MHDASAMRFALVVFFLGCAQNASAPVSNDPAETGGSAGSGKSDSPTAPTSSIPDVACTGGPDAGPAGSFRHLTSHIVANLGDPHHRGFDLIAPASDATQTIEGWIAYSIADKALEDEDVDLFACRESQWQKLGTATTDDEGHFSLDLTDSARLPIGLRDLYVSVAGDRTGAAFLAYVAPDDQELVASDVDGTLTSSENAFVESLALGGEPDAQPGAAAAFTRAKTAGLQLVYVTARGNQYTGDTRQWLADKGFPRGPLRLSPSFLTLPGGDTVAYKTATLEALPLPLERGIGNRASDVTAYAAAGLSPDKILVELPEYQSELQPLIDAGQATGFTDYATLF